MSVLADIAASTTSDIHCGPIWLRVLLCTLPEQLGHQQALMLAVGAAEKANEPDGVRTPKITLDNVTRAHGGYSRIAASVVRAVAMAGPDGAPVAWEPLRVVVTDAEEDLDAGIMSATTIDRNAPGCLIMAASVALHQLQSEAGVLRPFSKTTPSSSG